MMNDKMRCVTARETGFTLIELLVTMAIFMMVMLAVYSLFDSGQWFYLHSERKTKIQEIARMAMEQMERDIRMCGFGVPTGAKFSDTTRWTPDIFTATGGKFFFRADIDTGHSPITVNVAAGATTIYVEDPEQVCPNPGFSEIIMVQENRRWQPLLCTSATVEPDPDPTGIPGRNRITVSPYAPATGAVACNADECHIYTPEHIFYRLTPDTDNDGVCDNTDPGDDPFCEIQRGVKAGNDPTTNNDESLVTFETLASNIISMQITSGSLVQLTITARDRSMEGPQKYQDVTLSTQILVRDDAY